MTKYKVPFTKYKLPIADCVLPTKIIHYSLLIVHLFFPSLSHANPDSLSTQILANKKLVVKSITVDTAQQAWLAEAGIRLKRYIGRSADQAMMDGILKKFVAYNENNGYPFARAQFDSIRMDSNFFCAKLKMEKGSFISIDTLIVESNGSVRPRFMQNHLSLRKPRPYSEQYVQSIDSRINDLGFITTTQPLVVEFTPHAAKLYSYVDKSKANRANGLLAFGTDDDGKLQLQGEASIFLANMFKGGEELSLNWSSPDKNVQLLNVGVRLPYLILGTVGVNALFEMERRDTLYLSLHGRGGLSSRVGGYGSATLFVDMQRHSNSPATAEAHNSTVTALLYGAGYTQRRTNNLLFPRSGYAAYASLAVGTRRVETDDESTTGASLEGVADVAYYSTLSKRVSLMLRAQGKVKKVFADGETEVFFQSELYTIGGANSLRGFNERSLFTAAYAIATVEPQLYFSAQGYLSAFCDYAPVENGGKLSHLLSFGLGTRFATGVGIFSLSYALGKADSDRLLLKNAKVHVGYTVVF